MGAASLACLLCVWGVGREAEGSGVCDNSKIISVSTPLCLEFSLVVILRGIRDDSIEFALKL